MTNGGPGTRTELAAYYVYALAFVTRQVGRGAATTALTAIVLVITAVFLWLRERNT
jgi:raffinose/stachyose/melibiose transport system permease protein